MKKKGIKKEIFVRHTIYGMNTLISFKVFGKRAKKATKSLEKEAIRLEKLLSCFISESEISKINKSAGIKYKKISSDTFNVLSYALKLSSLCQGLFDVTIGPLAVLWRNHKKINVSPEDSEIKEILPMINYIDLVLDSHKKTAMLQKIGQSIDLGGIGKGYVGDRFLTILKKHGITSAFANIGGNVVTLGTKPDGSSWCVGIQHPRDENSLIGTISVTNQSVVTSGDYQRYFTDNNGRRWHHILNPFTGYPASSGLVSVTVIADGSMVADALSTALFVAGMERGIEIIKQFSEAEAIFVTTDLQVHITSGLIKNFQAQDGITVYNIN